MSTNVKQVLRDSAELTSLPDWLRKELVQAADRIDELERDKKQAIKERNELRARYTKVLRASGWVTTYD